MFEETESIPGLALKTQPADQFHPRGPCHGCDVMAHQTRDTDGATYCSELCRVQRHILHQVPFRHGTDDGR